MASIPCAAYQASHIHDHLRKQHRFEVRLRAASVGSDPSPPSSPEPFGQKTFFSSVSTEEIGRKVSVVHQGLMRNFWNSISSDKGKNGLGGSDGTLDRKAMTEIEHLGN
ncbi:hypothetical protein CAPTEDRAFT_227652 [Capitella teleta]|uniref:Uncharacterized protein n=1 Tax=Capitella teleta TaxID=283909 RepID=R7U1I2_CAPTE|nr:hypothetical protein CAPTEDRAFT_227652 [Capitella teleta]|eukprot:ELT97521.1 hypothetical protein CAPTEDRAFT_227652 [Capitella teleta]